MDLKKGSNCSGTRLVQPRDQSLGRLDVAGSCRIAQNPHCSITLSGFRNECFSYDGSNAESLEGEDRARPVLPVRPTAVRYGYPSGN